MSVDETLDLTSDIFVFLFLFFSFFCFFCFFCFFLFFCFFVFLFFCFFVFSFFVFVFCFLVYMLAFVPSTRPGWMEAVAGSRAVLRSPWQWFHLGNANEQQLQTTATAAATTTTTTTATTTTATTTYRVWPFPLAHCKNEPPSTPSFSFLHEKKVGLTLLEPQSRVGDKTTWNLNGLAPRTGLHP